MTIGMNSIGTRGAEMAEDLGTRAHNRFLPPPRSIGLRIAILMLTRGRWLASREPTRRLIAGLRVGVLTFFGLLMLGAPAARSIVVSVALMIAVALGANRMLINVAASGLAAAGLIAWALGVSIR